MYAIFEDGSRQYRVSVGDVVKIDYREAEAGSTLELNKVLLTADGTNVKVGQPLVEGAKVVTKVLGHTAEKTMIQYFRRRKNYKRLKGHTQPFIQVKVESIQLA